jgi:hypothetical protein
MNLNTEQIEILKQTINSTLENVYQNDYDLIERGGMEQSLSFRFGLYFSTIIKDLDWLKSHNIDLEYNKNGLNPKRTPRRPNGVRPDLILHKRGENINNVLVVEFKGWWNGDRESDLVKLEDFVNQDGEYKYGLGVFIEFNKEKPKIEYFNGY